MSEERSGILITLGGLVVEQIGELDLEPRKNIPTVESVADPEDFEPINRFVVLHESE